MLIVVGGLPEPLLAGRGIAEIPQPVDHLLFVPPVVGRFGGHLVGRVIHPSIMAAPGCDRAGMTPPGGHRYAAVSMTRIIAGFAGSLTPRRAALGHPPHERPGARGDLLGPRGPRRDRRRSRARPLRRIRRARTRGGQPRGGRGRARRDRPRRRPTSAAATPTRSTRAAAARRDARASESRRAAVAAYLESAVAARSTSSSSTRRTTSTRPSSRTTSALLAPLLSPDARGGRRAQLAFARTALARRHRARAASATTARPRCGGRRRQPERPSQPA